MEKEFITSTIGLRASHENIKDKSRKHRFSKMIRFEFYRAGDTVDIHAVNGENLDRIRSIATVSVPQEEFSDRPENDVSEYAWAAGLTGVLFRDSDFE